MTEIASTQSNAGIGTSAQRYASGVPARARQLPARPGQITVGEVLKATAQHFGTRPETLISGLRGQPFCRCRQIAMYVAQEMTGRDARFIARHMGNRAERTVLNGVGLIEGILAAGDAETTAAVRLIKERLAASAGEIAATPSPIKVHQVVKLTAAHFGITAEALLSDRRTKPLIHRRQVAMYLAREMTGRSTPVIGYYMGNRDHSTIVHGARAIKVLLDAGDVATMAAVSAIKKRLQALRMGRA